MTAQKKRALWMGALAVLILLCVLGTIFLLRERKQPSESGTSAEAVQKTDSQPPVTAQSPVTERPESTKVPVTTEGPVTTKTPETTAKQEETQPPKQPPLRVTDADGIVYERKTEEAYYSVISVPKYLQSVKIASSMEGLPVRAIKDGVGDDYDSTGEYYRAVSVQLPSTLESIGENVFLECFYLHTVIIPENVKQIGSGAFAHCDNLPALTIPAGVTDLGAGVGAGDRGLQVAQGNRKYRSEGNCIVDISAKTVISLGESAKIPADGSVTEVLEYLGGIQENTSFYPGSDLLRIPSGITKVKGYGQDHKYSYRGMTVTSPDTVLESISTSVVIFADSGSKAEQYANANGMHFYSFEKIGMNSDKEKELFIWHDPEAVGILHRESLELTILEDGGLKDSHRQDFASVADWNWIDWPENLTIYVAEGVERIPLRFLSGAFYAARRVILPSTLKEIAREGFWLGGVQEIVLPDADISLGEAAFAYCENLQSLTLPTTLRSIPENAFCGCSSLHITIPQTVTEIGINAFGGVAEILVAEGNPRYKVVNNCLIDVQEKAVISIGAGGVIPDDGSVTAIFGAGGVRELYVPAAIERIGPWAIYSYLFSDDGPCNTSSVEKIEFAPNSHLKVLEEWALANGLFTEIQLPESLEIIGDGALSNNSILQLTIPAGVKKFESFENFNLFYEENQDFTITFLSPTVEIGTFNEEYGNNLIVCGFSGSTAEAWAKENHLEFRGISPES